MPQLKLLNTEQSDPSRIYCDDARYALNFFKCSYFKTRVKVFYGDFMEQINLKLGIIMKWKLNI